MDFKTIKINEKHYPVKFGNNASRIFQAETGINPLKPLRTMGVLIRTLMNKGASGKDAMEEAFIEAYGPNEIVVLVYSGLKDGARKAGVPFNMSIDDVGDMLDEDKGAVNEIITFYVESMAPSKGSEPEDNHQANGQKKTQKKAKA